MADRDALARTSSATPVVTDITDEASAATSTSSPPTAASAEFAAASTSSPPTAALAGELHGITDLLARAKDVGAMCKELGAATASRCAEEVPPKAKAIIFKAAVPKPPANESKWRYLSNLATREFQVRLPIPSHPATKGCTYTCVEALYQSLKFNLAAEFAKGGALEGRKGKDLLNAVKPGFKDKAKAKEEAGAAEGYVALIVSRLWGDELQQARDFAPASLSKLDRVRPAAFTQIDSGLALLACQLLMLAQNVEATSLLVETEDKALEEFCDRAEGEFWARYRPPDDSGTCSGQNANGQNLMHARRLLRAGNPDYAARCANDLFKKLEKVLTGKEALSQYAREFYAHSSMTYSDVLENVRATGGPLRGFLPLGRCVPDRGSLDPLVCVAQAAAASAARVLKVMMGMSLPDDREGFNESCGKLGMLTTRRCAEQEIPRKSETIIFKSNVPKKAQGLPLKDCYFLSNFTLREFKVEVAPPSHPSIAGKTFTCVEALYQAIKFNRPEAFAKGGTLEGEAGARLLSEVKPGFIGSFLEKKRKEPAEGMVALSVFRTAVSGKLDKIQGLDTDLADFKLSRPMAFTLIDSGLILLACQLLMLSQSSSARELLEQTGSTPLEEYTDRQTGEFWSRCRPLDDGPTFGQNASGQNFMHLRQLLRIHTPMYLGEKAKDLFEVLQGCLSGEERLSMYARDFYNDEQMSYADLLQRVAPMVKKDGKPLVMPVDDGRTPLSLKEDREEEERDHATTTGASCTAKDGVSFVIDAEELKKKSQHLNDGEIYLRLADLRKVRITGDLSGLDFTGSDLSGAVLNHTKCVKTVSRHH